MQAQSVQINDWQRPHIGLQHLRQLSIVLLFLHPFRTAHNFDSNSANSQNFRPYLSGLLGIYCVYLQRLLHGNSCSSTVTEKSGVHARWLFVWNLSIMSPIRANLFFSILRDLVLLLPKRIIDFTNLYRFRDIVSEKYSRPGNCDQSRSFSKFF